MAYYEIVVESLIEKKRFREYPEIEITHIEEGKTLISGNFKDQTELFAVITKIRDMNLKLVLVRKNQEDLGGCYEKYN